MRPDKQEGAEPMSSVTPGVEPAAPAPIFIADPAIEENRAFCAVVDWGTTSFRLWLLCDSGEILGERRSGEGLTTALEIGFETILETHLEALGADEDCPVMMCGMVGSRQGWHEAPYLDAPVDLAKIFDAAVRVPQVGREILVLPGIAQRDRAAPDVMRGEETQLAGAATTGAFGTDETAMTLACLPGTHSKWAGMRGRTIAHFSTIMTGELFTLIADRSILRHTLHDAPQVKANDPAFANAVRAAFADPADWMAQLFRVRAGALLDTGDGTKGKAWLSGSLIGAEIAAAVRSAGAGFDPSRPIALIAVGPLAALYGAALTACGLAFDTVDADAAVRIGLYAAARRAWRPPSKDTR